MSYLGFLLRYGPEKFKPLFTNRRLILASVYNSNHVSGNNDFGIHCFKTFAPVHYSNNF